MWWQIDLRRKQLRRGEDSVSDYRKIAHLAEISGQKIYDKVGSAKMEELFRKIHI